MEDDRRQAANPYAPPTAALEVAPPPGEMEVRYVIYRYAVSALILTYYGHSEPVPVAANKTDWAKAVGYTLLSLVLGWWGLPWGPIRTIQAIFVNLTGGQDVTPLQNRRVHRSEDPDATWRCPMCQQPNSNRQFKCLCGYKLV